MTQPAMAEGATSGLCDQYRPGEEPRLRCALDNGYCPFDGDLSQCGERAG